MRHFSCRFGNRDLNTERREVPKNLLRQSGRASPCHISPYARAKRCTAVRAEITTVSEVNMLLSWRNGAREGSDLKSTGGNILERAAFLKAIITSAASFFSMSLT